jgi:hypothetical protein
MKTKITLLSLLFAILFLPAALSAMIAGSIDQIAPDTATRSGYLEIFGSNFGADGQVLIDGISAPVASWTPVRVVAYVPENSSLGSVGVQLVTDGGNTNTVPLNVTDRQASGHVNWRLRMEGAYSQVRPARGPDGTIYSIDVNGRLYAVAPGGELKWIARSAGDKGLDVGPDGTIYTGSENDVKAFQSDGVLKWTFVQNPRAMILIGISVGPDGNIYGVATEGIGVFSLTPSGVLRWASPEGYARRIVDYSEIVFGPNGASTQLYFYANNHLRAVALNGDSVFSSTSAAAQPVVSPLDGSVHIKAATFNSAAQLLWNFIFPDGWFETSDPAIGSDGTHYTTHRFSSLYALNPDGTEKWHVARPDFVGIPDVDPTNSLVVLGSNNTGDQGGFLEAIATDTQTATWRVDLPAEETGVFNWWTGQYGFNHFVDTRAKFSADGQNVYVVTAIATGGLVTDRCFLYSISTGIAPVPAPTATFRTSISLAAKKQDGVFTAIGTVNVVDENNGPVSGVAVRILWTLPDGQTQTQTVTSKKKGVVKFNAAAGHGTYNLTVLDASKTNYTFDILGSMLSASITK